MGNYSDITTIDGDKLKERREYLGMTQETLAARVSEVTDGRITVSRGYLAEIERNRKPGSRRKFPRRYIALALAEALDVGLPDLED